MIVSVPNTDKNRSGEFNQYTMIVSSLYYVCEYEYGQYSDCVSNKVNLGGARSDLVA